MIVSSYQLGQLIYSVVFIWIDFSVINLDQSFPALPFISFPSYLSFVFLFTSSLFVFGQVIVLSTFVFVRPLSFFIIFYSSAFTSHILGLSLFFIHFPFCRFFLLYPRCVFITFLFISIFVLLVRPILSTIASF